MQAKFLVPGQSFSVPVCTSSMRNCVCLRVSQSSVYITCEERKGIQEPWKRSYTHIGCEVDVATDDSQPILEVSKNSNGELDVEGYTKQVSEDGEPKASTGRGRGRKSQEILFPTDSFIIPAIAKELGISTATIYNRVRELIKQGKMKIAGTTRKEGARGKSTIIYQVVSENEKSKA